MTGALLNTATVVAGSTLGLLLRRRLSRVFEERMLQAMGVFTLALGFSMFLKTQEPLIALVALVSGGALGTWWGLTGHINRLGDGVKRLIHKTRLRVGAQFTEGFVTASILFCVGPMTILGSINDGLRGDYELLAIKSAMDFVASFSLSATLGWGVAVSGLTVLVVQGGLTLSAAWLAPALSHERVVADLTGLGGLIIVIIGFKLARLGKWEPADFLPALLIAPALTWIVIQRIG
jgi:hypothetical protein